MKYKFVLFIALLFSLGDLCSQQIIDWVNPFIGSSNYGATNPGAIRPAGMASVVPFNAAFKKGEENPFEKDSEWHSRPYVWENKFLTGFSHVNLSGVGCPELGSILVMPTTGELIFDAEQYGSTFSDQKARPNSYSCQIDKYNVQAELTAAIRTGVSRYRFPAGQANLILNAGLGLTNETGAMLRVVSNQEVEGFKMIGTFCYNPEDVRPVYFVMRLNKPADDFGAWKKMPKYKSEAAWTAYDDKYKPYKSYTRDLAGENLGAYFSYNVEEGEQVEVRIGVSYVSIENARENLEKETNNKSFEEIQKEGELEWEKLLNRIQVKGGSDEDKTIFYTALYHLLIHPNILQDYNGDYPSMDGYEILNTNGKNRYTVFSLWDTYRNVHPFLSLVYPELQSQMVNSMVDMYKESGWLPKWELLSLETTVMVGDPATPVIADTYLRGIQDFDVDLAYQAAKKASTQIENNKLRPGIQQYDSLGFILEEYNNYGSSVSSTLEYNISDWNLAQLAKELGKEKDADFFTNRSMSYKNYFDKESGMLRPIMTDRKFLNPFDPEAGKNFEPVIGFVEGNAWQYRFYVPHDIKGLIQLLGGQKNFLDALETCFITDNYDMANEPDITYAYLYNFIEGEEWRAQKRVRELVDKYYFNAPDGIPGNDDTGTLSVWLLYSMMGFYPHCPGDMSYALASPVFDEIRITLNEKYYDGKELKISAQNAKEGKNIFIDQVKWNNKKVKSFFIDHHLLTKGGELKFKLKANPK